MGKSDHGGRTVALVVAAGRNRVIGSAGRMPWHVPGDLKTFRRLTMGRPIVMGRKTFQSIGRALDGRTNIVITRDPAFQAADVTVAASLEAALTLANGAPSADNSIMVIGGGEIYRAALPYADMIYLTEIAAEPDGDTWFPALASEEWTEIEQMAVEPDPRDDHAAVLRIFRRVAAASGD